MTLKVLVLNGPNLNMLGVREPTIYGSETLSDIEALCQREGKSLSMFVSCRQSNDEGELVTWIHGARDNIHGLLINGGGLYSHVCGVT